MNLRVHNSFFPKIDQKSCCNAGKSRIAFFSEISVLTNVPEITIPAQNGGLRYKSKHVAKKVKVLLSL